MIAFLAGKRCLVLDDEYLIAVDIQLILEDGWRCSVACVGTADEAMAALAEKHIDLAVLDIKLSDAAGDSMTIAAVLSERQIGFVFLTGMRGDEAQVRAFPGVPVVEKPYQEPVLLEALRRALSRS